MSKHTPGPWKLKHVKNGHHIFMGQATRTPWHYPSHCKIEYEHDVWPEDGEQYEEAEANARLIAAAPELLGVCKSALSFIEALRNNGTINRTWSGEERLRQIIAKATANKK